MRSRKAGGTVVSGHGFRQTWLFRGSKSRIPTVSQGLVGTEQYRL